MISVMRRPSIARLAIERIPLLYLLARTWRLTCRLATTAATESPRKVMESRAANLDSIALNTAATGVRTAVLLDGELEASNENNQGGRQFWY